MSGAQDVAGGESSHLVNIAPAQTEPKVALRPAEGGQAPPARQAIETTGGDDINRADAIDIGAARNILTLEILTSPR